MQPPILQVDLPNDYCQPEIEPAVQEYPELYFPRNKIFKLEFSLDPGHF